MQKHICTCLFLLQNIQQSFLLSYMRNWWGVNWSRLRNTPWMDNFKVSRPADLSFSDLEDSQRLIGFCFVSGWSAFGERSSLSDAPLLFSSAFLEFLDAFVNDGIAMILPNLHAGLPWKSQDSFAVEGHAWTWGGLEGRKIANVLRKEQ